jgi:hypothetical protein
MPKLETLPEHLIQRILEFFQTKKVVKIDNLDPYELNFLIRARRKNLINGVGIKTDLKTILSFSGVCKRFNSIIKSDIGKLMLTVYYNSKDLEIANVLEHISYCHQDNCRNICHYVNKDIKHTDLIKKIAVSEFNERKKTKHVEDLAKIFRHHLTIKQVESYYKIKKMDKKLKDYETSKLSKSSELDSISLNSDSSS